MTPAESGLQLTSRGIPGVPPDAVSTIFSTIFFATRGFSSR